MAAFQCTVTTELVNDGKIPQAGIYVTMAGRRVVILRVFIKKTDKTPKRELDLAEKRMKEL